MGNRFKIKNELGNRYGRLVVVKHLGGALWLCKCDCGGELRITGSRLRRLTHGSCGCYKPKRGMRPKIFLEDPETGEMMPIMALADKYNISRTTAKRRFSKGNMEKSKDEEDNIPKSFGLPPRKKVSDIKTSRWEDENFVCPPPHPEYEYQGA